MLEKKKLFPLCAKLERKFNLLTALEFSGWKYVPRIHVTMGKDSFANKDIVLGLTGQYAEWCTNEAELFLTMSYVRGHEAQHVLSTTSKAWMYALRRGTEVIIEKLVKDNGIYVRLSTDRDYISALEELKKKGIFLSMEQVATFVHYITNSIEDGRIEAIRASAKEDFKQQMIFTRRKTWAEVGIPANACTVDKLSIVAKLRIILNQVLSLSTQGIYQKGFAEHYFGTELEDRLRETIPYIAKGVTARTCRKMADNAIIVCELLADLIAEASQIPEFNDTITWIKRSIKDFDFGERNTEEKDEQENENGDIPFDNSDLYIELPDDEYDELMERLKENPQEEDEEGGRNIHIRREHPKEEEEELPSATSQDSNGKSKSEEETAQETSEEETYQEGSNGGDAANETSNEENQIPEEDNSSDNKTENSSSKGADLAPNKGGSSAKQAGNSTSSDGTANEDDILEEMRRAAEAALGMAEDSSKNMDTILHGQEKRQSLENDQTEKVKKTSNSVISQINSMNEEWNGMKLMELERKYEVSELLPPDLMREVETLQKKLEQFLKDKKAKYRRQLKSGKLDSSRLAMLAANEINVFKEQKKSKGVSACTEILLDNSGSMGYGAGSKREAACKALTKIEMVFAKYFPIKIFAFDYTGAVIHEVIKGWNEHFSRSGAWNFLTKGRYGSGNMDPYSIRVATADILSRPEKKKLLIILSDGAPCCEPIWVTQAVQDARKNGVKVVSIFFTEEEYRTESEEEFFIKMYEKDCIVCNPDEIGEHLIKVLQKFFS